MTVLETLQAERAKYGPRIKPAEAVAILNAVAWIFRLNYGLFRAPAGGNGALHANGFVRCDILADKGAGRIFDVFRDGPDASQDYAGEAEVVWQDKGSLELDRFVAPSRPEDLAPPEPAPPPPQPPQPPAPFPAPVEGWSGEEIAGLLDSLERIADGLGGIREGMEHLNARLEQAEKTGIKLRIGL